MKRLTAKDRLFCFEYLADEKLNPERAAIKVGYSESVAKSKAYQWVSNSKENTKPQVKAFIDQLIKNRQKDLELDGKKIDDELCKIAFSNISDILETMNGHINIKLMKLLTDAQKCAIAEITEIEVDGVITRKLKMHNKLRALEVLSKRIGKGNSSRYLTVNIIKDGEVVESKTREIGSLVE